MRPRISVVLPTFNRSNSLLVSVASVLNQTYENLELIVVDDGSTDDTLQVLSDINDPRLVVVSLNSNRGASAARNAGVDRARGELIAFQDSDVVWRPEKLELQVHAFDQAPANVGVVYCSVERVRGGQSFVIPGKSAAITDGDLRPQLVWANIVDTPTAVVRRVAGVRFDETLKFLEDWDLFLGLSSMWEFCFVPETLVVSQFTVGSLNQQADAIRADTLSSIIEKHCGVFRKFQPALARQCQLIGYHYLYVGEYAQAKPYIDRALSIVPLSLKARLTRWLWVTRFPLPILQAWRSFRGRFRKGF